MNQSSRTFFILSSILLFGASLAAAVNVTVNPDTGRLPISPLIYGVNGDIGVPTTSYRQGGNRMTGYNWETNASNAGSDYLHQSDDYLTWVNGITGAAANTPGIVTTNFHDSALAAGAQYSIATLQLAGYVAKDKSGSVSEGQAAPSSRWLEVAFTKGSAFSLTPDTTDNKVYMDEYINFLVNRYGPASSPTGIKAYNLDNEPDLWASTHVRLHPAKPTCVELLTQNIEAAKAVKRVDPAAETFGFVSYGFGGYLDFQSAPDWATERTKGSYRWFVDYYLDQMKKASDTAGKRLLDVLDLHNYSEARGGGERINADTAAPENVNCNKARLQAPRSYWDNTYTEDSWIGQYYRSYLPFLPNIRQSIDSFYPGTKLALTEYNFGGGGHVSGGIAQADTLGIFGQHEIYAANLWPLNGTQAYIAAAFRLYRNYDGSGSRYGDTVVTAAVNNIAEASAYASIAGNSTGELHVILLNKNYDNATEFNFTIGGTTSYGSARVYAFDASSAVVNSTVAITERSAITGIVNNQFSYTLPPLTAAHVVLTAADVAPTITTQPAAQSVTGGTPVTFTAAASGTPAPTFQWQKGGVDIPGATSASYTISSTQASDEGSYSVVATNSAGSATSNAVSLTLTIPAAFDVAGYYARNADVAAFYGSDQLGAWLHYYNYGLAEGRQFDAQFIVGEYLLLNTDLTNAFGSDLQAALLHWLTYGKPIEDRIGRVPIGFNVDSYLARYPDLAAAFGAITPTALRNVTVWNHYLDWGVTEGRSDGDFEAYNYLATNADLAAVFGTDVEAAALHWYFYGRREGRRIPSNFSVSGYRTRNPDVATVWGNDLYGCWLHFRDTGVYEGRNYDDLFRVLEYRARYSDVQTAYGNNLTGVLNHWLFYGKPEGRLGRNP